MNFRFLIIQLTDVRHLKPKTDLISQKKRIKKISAFSLPVESPEGGPFSMAFHWVNASV
jgi:hypothetical protein